ncbi:hypothetical protein PRZ48_002267 [Zasmidium cellare]|uniref:O-methyltransferase n=1 Tax=Zasmidium cellare TaxID=395010 RepID=A0ABR0F5P6_ZASCE|nr:hypothetical protein PRZ48_002267 [Zasmidium cellare]
MGNLDISEAVTSIRSLCASVQHDDDARGQLKAELDEARKSLETPVEALWTLLFQYIPTTALNALVNMGAVDRLNESEEPLSVKALAEACGADESVVHRLIRPMGPLGVVEELPGPMYLATPLSKLLSDPGFKGGYIFQHSLGVRAMAGLPPFLQKTGYKMPMGAPGPFQYALQTEDSIYEYMTKDGDLLSHFEKFMARSRADRPEWFTFYPVKERLFSQAVGSEPHSDVMMVDIGGGQGHDIQAFRTAFPDAPGRLVLQDTETVLGSIKTLDSTIEKQPHDFFTPQPVHGARAYYLRQIIHNYSDEEALEILANVKMAMTPGYSLLLLDDFCLPDEKAPYYPALLDVLMMAAFTGTERTETQWYSLLDRAGFKINRIYRDVAGQGESVIEAEPK